MGGCEKEKEIALMRRMILLLTVAAVMAAMLVVMAAPAMAKGSQVTPSGRV